MRSITIDGNGYTIDAQGQGRIFNIINYYEDNPKIYLYDITVAECNYSLLVRYPMPIYQRMRNLRFS